MKELIHKRMLSNMLPGRAVSGWKQHHKILLPKSRTRSTNVLFDQDIGIIMKNPFINARLYKTVSRFKSIFIERVWLEKDDSWHEMWTRYHAGFNNSRDAEVSFHVWPALYPDMEVTSLISTLIHRSMIDIGGFEELFDMNGLHNVITMLYHCVPIYDKRNGSIHIQRLNFGRNPLSTLSEWKWAFDGNLENDWIIDNETAYNRFGNIIDQCLTYRYDVDNSAGEIAELLDGLNPSTKRGLQMLMPLGCDIKNSHSFWIDKDTRFNIPVASINDLLGYLVTAPPHFSAVTTKRSTPEVDFGTFAGSKGVHRAYFHGKSMKLKFDRIKKEMAKHLGVKITDIYLYKDLDDNVYLTLFTKEGAVRYFYNLTWYIMTSTHLLEEKEE